MLSPELSTDFLISLIGFAAFLAIIVALLCLRWAMLARDQAAACAQWVEHSNKRSYSLKKIADIETTLTDLTDSYDSILKQHKRLRSRIGMRANREKKIGDVADEAVSELAKERDKNALRLQCKQRGLLK